MILRTLALLAFAALAPQGERGPADVSTRMSSPDAAERAAAQRWLAAHLTGADRPLIEARLKTSDPETRGRWIEILASEDRLALLAASFAASEDAPLASAGRAALSGSIMRWSPRAAEPGITSGELAEAMNVWTGPRIEVDRQLALAPLEDVLDLCALVTTPPVGLVVDAAHDSARTSKTAAPIKGSFASVLRELALRHGLHLVGFSCREEDPPSVRWLALVPRTNEVLETPSALEMLLSWSIAFAKPGDEKARSVCARAIAASGWPTGISLLEQGSRNDGDAAALDGLMLAARRGRVAPHLASAEGQARLRAEVDRRLSTNDPVGAVAAARSLGATGVRGPEARELHAAVLDECVTLNGLPLFTRLVELDMRRPHDAATKAALEQILVRDDIPIGARFLALEMRARLTAPLEGLAHARECVEFAARAGRLADMGRWLRDARAFPPESWRDPTFLPADWTFAMRAFVVGAWLARGETGAAVEHVSFALTRSDKVNRETLAEALRRVARAADPTAADALFAGLDARTDVDRAQLSRFIVQAGGDLPDAALDELLASVPQPVHLREDWLVLGSLAASSRGPKVRTRLVEALGGEADADDLMAGLALAVEGLRAKRDFELEREFENSVRASEGGRSARLRQRLRIGRWPAPPEGDLVCLGLQDRSASRFGL